MSSTTFYKGYKEDTPNINTKILWLSTSPHYEEQWGNKIAIYEIDDDTIKCPTRKDLEEMIGVKCDEEYFEMLYHPTHEFVEELKQNGFNSYYFEEDEYHCIVLALFDKSIAIRIK